MALQPRLGIALGALALALVLVLIHSSVVSGDGCGDYPPPPAGDWDIDEPTVMWNEERTINGSLNVNNGSLTLTNVTLYINGHLRIEAPTNISHSIIIVNRFNGSGGGGGPGLGGLRRDGP